MSKKTIDKNEKLSSALKENLKLRKKQIKKRDEKNIRGKRLSKVGYSSGLVMRLNVDLSNTQRMAINVYKDKKSAMKIWDVGGKDIVNQVKESGVKVEIQEGKVSVFDFGPDLDLTKLKRY